MVYEGNKRPVDYLVRFLTMRFNSTKLNSELACRSQLEVSVNREALCHFLIHDVSGFLFQIDLLRFTPICSSVKQESDSP